MGTTPKDDSKTKDEILQPVVIKTIIMYENDYEDFGDDE